MAKIVTKSIDFPNDLTLKQVVRHLKTRAGFLELTRVTLNAEFVRFEYKVRE